MIMALQREDVVLPGDLALRKAIQAAYQLDHLPTQQEVLAIAENWRPYRSLATSYLFSATFERTEAPPVARGSRPAGTSASAGERSDRHHHAAPLGSGMPGSGHQQAVVVWSSRERYVDVVEVQGGA